MKRLFWLAVLAGIVYLGYLVRKEKPGEGPKAKAGKAAVQPVINALEGYHAVHSAYPPDIETLATEGGGLPSQVLGHPLRYEREGAGYDLTFSYATPLPVHCTYNPETRWKCGFLKS
ncbi:MAG TPA: hypothetical protein VGP80_04775 [Gemmatimonadales bacterium]|nr:hypothetical protein [Gemmatimonadales bacterium]